MIGRPKIPKSKVDKVIRMTLDGSSKKEITNATGLCKSSIGNLLSRVRREAGYKNMIEFAYKTGLNDGSSNMYL